MTNRATSHPAPGHTLADRPRGFVWGWEPTEELLLDMIAAAGFTNVEIVSTSPHRGETEGRRCGNRTYCVATAPTLPAPVAVIDVKPLQPFPA